MEKITVNAKGGDRKMNILIAEDEKPMLDILSTYFVREGFEVFKANNGKEALEIFESNNIDLAILDWMMPEVDGIEVCKYIKENSDTKVLILTAKSQSDDEVEALQIGADEYVKKPFDPRILIVRAKKLIDFNNEIHIKDLKIDISKKRVYRGSEEIRLTKNELSLLVTFIKNKGIILSRDRLVDLVWGVDYEGDYRTVDTHIRRLREKIGEDLIKTYRGIGYSLEVDLN